MREWAKFDWENRSANSALICLHFSGIVAFSLLGKSEYGETKNRTGEEQFVFKSLFSSYIFNEILWSVDANVQRRWVRAKQGKQKYGIENGILRTYYVYALIALCNVLTTWERMYVYLACSVKNSRLVIHYFSPFSFDIAVSVQRRTQYFHDHEKNRT